ncbi:MAG: YigZ family protein [Bacteroidetes bacterium]|nr:YigZ family protein [Bacteroidota bacterium]
MEDAWTVAHSSTSEYKERGSRFLGFLYPVSNRGEIDRQLQALRVTYADSRHICYAWRLGTDALANDAGEPAHSAGAPILRALRSAGITHALLVVVRYFGGTKLGIPGLIQAYGETARLAIVCNSLQRWEPRITLKVTFAYSQTSAATQIAHVLGARLVGAVYTDLCVQLWNIPEQQLLMAAHALQEATITFEQACEDSAPLS